jgi:hypothetical protein
MLGLRKHPQVPKLQSLVGGRFHLEGVRPYCPAHFGGRLSMKNAIPS